MRLIVGKFWLIKIDIFVQCESGLWGGAPFQKIFGDGEISFDFVVHSYKAIDIVLVSHIFFKFSKILNANISHFKNVSIANIIDNYYLLDLKYFFMLIFLM